MLAEAALGAIASAILQHAASTELPPRLRQWLGREPARLAVQQALARAYTVFARQYPDLAAGLFDEAWLGGAAAAELARLLRPGPGSDPARLAALWAGAVWASADAASEARRAWQERAVRPAAEFVGWLEAELKAEPALAPLFDARRLKGIEARLDELAAELRRSLAAALERAAAAPVAPRAAALGQVAGDYVAGDKSVIQHIAGDVVSGDKVINQVYHLYLSGSYASLAHLYIPPDDVFQRVRAGEFTGRRWLEARLDAYLNDPAQPYGAFVLEGEAGLGKTSFLAHLVRERRYLHLFAEQVRGEASLSRALQSLGAQIVSRYRLAEYAQGNTLPAIAAYPDFLSRLLRAAARELAPGEKLVIVCDGLDEAGALAGGNVFGLPEVLPPGVYLVLSRRPAPPVRLHFREFQPWVVPLQADSDENRADLREHLALAARRPEIAAQLRANGYSADDFVSTLAEKSAGVWMYLYYALDEVARGRRAPLDLARLPDGLAAWYAEFWGRWRSQVADWDELYAPLLATLAAAQTPLSLERWLAWAGVAAKPYAVRRLAADHWGAYARAGPDGYALQHASLREFLLGQGGGVGEAANFATEMRERALAAHARIVAALRAQCGGDWPALAVDNDARPTLALHLAGAGRLDELRRLVAGSSAWAEARYRAEGHYAGFLADLRLAWCQAEEPAGWEVGLQLRCALIQSSLNSLAGNLPETLPAQLVECQLWTAAQGLTHVSSMLDDDTRAEALAALASHLPAASLPAALALARTIEAAAARARALSVLAEHLPAGQQPAVLAETLAAAWEMDGVFSQASILGRLLPQLPAEQRPAVLAQAWERIRGADEAEDGWAVLALAQWAPHLPPEQQAGALADLLEAARADENRSRQVEALGLLAQHRPPQALAIASAIPDDFARADALAALAPHLPAALLDEALAAARAISETHLRGPVLVELALRLPGERRGPMLPDLLAAARAAGNEYVRAGLLARLSVQLPDQQQAALLAEALAAARLVGGNLAGALSTVAQHLPARQKAPVLREALAAARAVHDDHARADALVALGKHVPPELLDEALAAARAIGSLASRAWALASLAPRQPAVLDEALAIVRAIPDEAARTAALRRLIPQLPDSRLAEVLALARSIQDDRARMGALAALTPRLPDLRAEAMAAAQAVGYDLAQVLGPGELMPHALTPLYAAELALTQLGLHPLDPPDAALIEQLQGLPPEHQQALLAEALRAACSQADDFRRAGALRALAPLLSTAQLSWPSLWPGCLQALARRRRADLLYDLAALAPLVRRLGGPTALRELLSALRDVAAWWP